FSSPVISGGAVFVGSDDGGVYALNVTASKRLARALYWDSAYAQATSIPGQLGLRDWVRDHDYQVVDAVGLAKFKGDQVASRPPSVVVFATDHAPPSVAGSSADTVLLRRYLNAGGRIVDPGIAPLLWPRDSATGDRDLKDINRAAPAQLLGVTFEQGN